MELYAARDDLRYVQSVHLHRAAKPVYMEYKTERESHDTADDNEAEKQRIIAIIQVRSSHELKRCFFLINDKLLIISFEGEICIVV